MRQRRLLWHILPAYIAITALALLLTTFYSSSLFKKTYIKNRENELYARNELVKEIVKANINNIYNQNMLFEKVGQKIGTRITVINQQGLVLIDSDNDPDVMENHKTRPELRDAFTKGSGTAFRYSKTLKKDMVYYASRLNINEASFLVRTSMPADEIYMTLFDVYKKNIFFLIIITILTSIASFFVATKISNYLKNITAGAKRFSKGELNHKLPVYKIKEFTTLSTTMNQMADEISKQIETISEERNKVSAILVEMSKVESIRKDFVSNVSHELRTPVTSIKGYVETLLDGALDDKKTAIKFLEIVSKQTERLREIIEDLLSLSRIEQDDEKKEIKRIQQRIMPVIESAVTDCKIAADKKNIVINIEGDKDPETLINGNLIEQAVVNLINNSINYSPERSIINVTLTQKESSVIISVQDHGCGIPKEHHERLFERFYRVDKGRDRKIGGTGLGLAIVKHIAQVHKGKVYLESEVGEGSTFFVEIPLNNG